MDWQHPLTRMSVDLNWPLRGQRFIDITRTGRAAIVFGALNPQLKDANFRIFPIPQSAVPDDADNLGGVNQNPGY
jgi:starch-binding outer membrane protein, SusD/RagB family